MNNSYNNHSMKLSNHSILPYFLSISTIYGISIYHTISCQLLLNISIDEFDASNKPTCCEFVPNSCNIIVGYESGEISLIAIKLFDINNINNWNNNENNENSENKSENKSDNNHKKEINYKILAKKRVAAKLKPKIKNNSKNNTQIDSKNDSKIDTQNDTINQSKLASVLFLKFSPNNEYLAVACDDNLIHILSLTHQYKRVNICRGHSNTILNIDYSIDSNYLQSNDCNNNILYWNLNNSINLLIDSYKAKDIQWNSYTCRFGWAVQGIYSTQTARHNDNNNHNSTKNHIKSKNVKKTKELIEETMSDDFHVLSVLKSTNVSNLIVTGNESFENGIIRLYRYPVLPNALSRSYNVNCYGINSMIMTYYNPNNNHTNNSENNNENCAQLIYCNQEGIFQWNILDK